MGVRFDLEKRSYQYYYNSAFISVPKKSFYLPLLHNVINVVAHRHKQIKEQPAARFHLLLHRAAALERAPTADDKCEVVRSQTRVRVRRVRVRISCAAQDRANLDAILEPLLAQSYPFKLDETVSICRTIYARVTQDDVAHAGVEESSCNATSSSCCHALLRVPAGEGFWTVGEALLAGAGVGWACPVGLGFESPDIAALVVHKSRIVVAFVEILEHTREDFRFFVGQFDASDFVALVQMSSADCCKVRRVAENVLVGSEKPLFTTDHDGDDRAGQTRPCRARFGGCRRRR